MLNCRNFAVAVAGGSLMFGCATTFTAGAPEGAVDVVAHRGASAYAPENTLSAFALAVEQGADWFELDCTLTRDGEVVCIHDDDLERTTGVAGRVADADLAAVRALDAGAWMDPRFAGERIPLLAEALDLAKGKAGVYIEVKNSAHDDALMRRIFERMGGEKPLTESQRSDMMRLIEDSRTRNLELTRKVVDLVRERRMQRQVVIQSFSPIVCAIALVEAPGIRTELLAGKDDDHPERWPLYLQWLKMLEPAGFNISLESLDEPLLADLHRHGQTAAVWTVDDEAEMRRLAALGVDAIITNRPDICLRVLGRTP